MQQNDRQRKHQQSARRKNNQDEGESVGDQILEEVDDALGCSNRLLGCSLSLITLPFRLIGKLIGFVTDIFD